MPAYPQAGIPVVPLFRPGPCECRRPLPAWPNACGIGRRRRAGDRVRRLAHNFGDLAWGRRMRPCPAEPGTCSARNAGRRKHAMHIRPGIPAPAVRGLWGSAGRLRFRL